MSADEMFEKLGYKKEEIKGIDGNICEIEYYNNKYEVGIKMDLIHKGIYIIGADIPAFIVVRELQAIYKKCKELGWL